MVVQYAVIRTRRKKGLKVLKNTMSPSAFTPVIIICRSHGNTLQVPDTHINSGCRLCADELNAKRLTKTLEQFIDEAKNVHGDIYNYDNVDYKITTEKVLITCELHGDFPQTPDSHLAGHGCPRCFNKNEGRLAVILNEIGGLPDPAL